MYGFTFIADVLVTKPFEYVLEYWNIRDTSHILLPSIYEYMGCVPPGQEFACPFK
jgi:hypothetical protein